MADQSKEQYVAHDRRVDEMPKGEPREVEGQSDEEFLEQAKEEIRQAGDLYGTEIARDDRLVRENLGNQPPDVDQLPAGSDLPNDEVLGGSPAPPHDEGDGRS